MVRGAARQARSLPRALGMDARLVVASTLRGMKRARRSVAAVILAGRIVWGAVRHGTAGVIVVLLTRGGPVGPNGEHAYREIDRAP